MQEDSAPPAHPKRLYSFEDAADHEQPAQDKYSAYGCGGRHDERESAEDNHENSEYQEPCPLPAQVFNFEK